VSDIPGILTRRLDPAWTRGEPSALLPDYRERMAALVLVHPAIAAATASFVEAFAGAGDAAALQQARNAALSRESGALTEALALMPTLSAEEKRSSGRALNLAKALLEAAEKAKREHLEQAREDGSALDVTLPGRRPWSGRPHVLAQVRDELLDLFHGLGFSVYTSPEVELEPYNFGKLNFAPDHPARDAHDTYFVSPDVVLRTHTSPGWVRAMEERQPPLRLVFPGRVYRAEAVDASHMDQFHQIDGLYVARNVSMADLKATLNTFARAIYRRDVPTRIIPIYFPFVEPGAGRAPLPRVQGHEVGRGAGRRHGASQRVPGRGLRPRAGDRVRVRHGAGAHHHGPARHPRDPAVPRERRALPGAVLR